MKPPRVHPWYQAGTLYQIYPLSFRDSNGDGYGDLRGIINHLDYLNDGTAESLGVTAVWLSPIYRSPMRDWGYDVTDHCAVDPLFGTLDDLDELIAKLHGRGMKLLLDFVANHTSDQHAWFVESRSSRTNPKRDWYIWADERQGAEPNNWLSHFGGSAWEYDPATKQYYLHSFLKEQPDLNWRNPEVREAMLEVLRFWIRRGVDGFRVDAPLGLIKDAQLRDNPPNPNYRPGDSLPTEEFLQIYNEMQSGLDEVMGSLCEVVDDGSGTYLMSETYLNLPGLTRMYRACKAHPIHAPFNLNLLALEWNAPAFSSFVSEYEASLGPDDWPNYVVGNHDRLRLASRYGTERARTLAFLQFTLRGLPVIYNGDELGLENAVIKTTSRRDTTSHEPNMYRSDRDGARTPFPWNGERHGGFTDGEPWLPVSQDYIQHNVEAESRDGESTLELYRHLIHLRQHLPSLAEGNYRLLRVDNEQIFAFVRETSQHRSTVVVNFNDQPERVRLARVGRWIAGTHEVNGDGEVHSAETMTLQPNEARLYELRGGK